MIIIFLLLFFDYGIPVLLLPIFFVFLGVLHLGVVPVLALGVALQVLLLLALGVGVYLRRRCIGGSVARGLEVVADVSQLVRGAMLLNGSVYDRFVHHVLVLPVLVEGVLRVNVLLLCFFRSFGNFKRPSGSMASSEDLAACYLFEHCQRGEQYPQKVPCLEYLKHAHRCLEE